MNSYQTIACSFCDHFPNSTLCSISKEDLVDFDIKKNFKTFKKGELIIKEGDQPKGIYCVKSGKVKVFRLGYYGKEQIIRFSTSSDLIGYRSVLSDENFAASASALTEVVACFIPNDLILNQLDKNPTFAKQLLKMATHELGEASRTITTLAQKTVRERLAEVLFFLEEKMGLDKEGFIAVSLTREEIANLIGTATESAIRLISEFKGDSLIKVEGRKIKIINRVLLKKRAGI